MHPLSLWTYVLLFFTGLAAGLVDSIAGGGGLIALPTLFSVGFPAPLALGTNKFQSCFGSVSASWHYRQQGLVNLKECAFGMVLTFLGALAGALTVRHIDADLLGRTVPWLLAAILLYTILRPQLGSEDRASRMTSGGFYLVFGLGLGCYDGFFGPGVGSFWAMAFVLLLGQNFARATASTKVMNATSNLASLAIFLPAGLVHFGAGAVMAVGQLVGARLGAGLVVTRGARLVRPIFLIMVAATLGRLMWVSYFR